MLVEGTLSALTHPGAALSIAFVSMQHAVEVASLAAACAQIVAVNRARGGPGSCAVPGAGLRSITGMCHPLATHAGALML